MNYFVRVTMQSGSEKLERDILVDSDLDAEGEEESDVYQMDAQLQDAVHRAYAGDAGEESKNHQIRNDQPTKEPDAEGETDIEVNTDGPTEESEPVGAVKQSGDDASFGDEEVASDALDIDADPAFENNESSSSDASDAEGEEDWEAESNGAEDAEADNISRGNCM